MKGTTATIYDTTGDKENAQKVLIVYDYYSVKKWLGSAGNQTNFIVLVELLEPLTIEPSDLDEDIKVSIAEAIGQPPYDMVWHCEVSPYQISETINA